MTSDYLNIKSLFYDDKSIIEGMEALKSVDENLQHSTARLIWEKYVNNTHGNQQQINLELAQNPELIKEITDLDKKLLLDTFKLKIDFIETHTKLRKESVHSVVAESVLDDGTFEYSKEKLNLDIIKDISARFAVIDRVLNSDGNEEDKKALREDVRALFPKTVKYQQRKWYNRDQFRYDLDGRNAQLYITNMICEGEEFPEYYVDKVLTTSGKTRLFDTSTTWAKAHNQQNPLHVAWLLSTWKKQTASERTILLAGEIHQEDTVEKFRTMVLQSPAHYHDKSKFVQENHRIILSNLTTIERFLGPDFDVDFSTDEGLMKVHKLAKAIKELLDTYSKDEELCKLLKTIQGPKDPRTFEQRSLPDVGSDNQKRILEALKSNPSGLSSNELKEQAGITRLRLSEDIKSYIDEVDDRYTLKEEFRPPFKGLSVYIHEKLWDKCFTDHIVEHIETLEPSTSNFNLYIEILKEFDLFSESISDYIEQVGIKNFRSLFNNCIDYPKKANDLPDEKQKLDRIRMIKQILWAENPFKRVWSTKEKYHNHLLEWTQCCIEMNLDKELSMIDFTTYKEYRNSKKWEEHSFSVYSSDYLSKVTRFLLDQ